jgi:Ca2+-binding RTX toxin-like protein
MTGTGSNALYGGADIIHGESGDDVIYGGTGNDTIFGDGQNDLLYGNSGGDWISGGTGDDAVLGDDGLIMVQRNGTAEPLYNLLSNAPVTLTSPGPAQSSDVYVVGTLRWVTDLEPFTIGGNDIIYGGLGNDSLHGGAGDDAISGAEALVNYYDNGHNPLAYLQTLIAAGYYTAGNVLGYDTGTTLFRYYNPSSPFAKVVLPNGVDFLLNFAAGTSAAPIDDGQDVIFGDVGNDWIVGGTNRDHLWGGYGDDYLQADDNLDTSAANNTPDARTDSFFADVAYGGAGRDVLIGNTAQDRLIDWAGEFNTFLVPYNPFGEPTVTRQISPGIKAYVLDLANADGEDRTRGANEWDQELGEVAQGDPDWSAQTGGPRDPQNVKGAGSRDSTAVLAPYTGPYGVATISPPQRSATTSWAGTTAATIACIVGASTPITLPTFRATPITVAQTLRLLGHP